ncbi:MAG TPA: rod-binding protein [Rhizomicrobium sp.]|jgi:Rod binding domain-containing protein
MDAAIQSTTTLAQQALLAAPPRRVSEAGGGSVPASGNQISPTANEAKADAASKEYESIFISQFLGSMFSGIQSDTLTGGGQGEEMFRSLMINAYAKGIENQGGFGIAAQMKAELLKHQQVAQ